MPNLDDPWETLARYAALQEDLEGHDATVYLDFLSSIQQLENENLRWKNQAVRFETIRACSWLG